MLVYEWKTVRSNVFFRAVDVYLLVLQLHDLELSHKSLSTDYAKLEKEKNEEFVVVTPANPQEDITGLKVL